MTLLMAPCILVLLLSASFLSTSIADELGVRQHASEGHTGTIEQHAKIKGEQTRVHVTIHDNAMISMTKEGEEVPGSHIPDSETDDEQQRSGPHMISERKQVNIRREKDNIKALSGGLADGTSDKGQFDEEVASELDGQLQQRQRSFLDECREHANGILQSSPSPVHFRNAVAPLCGPEFFSVEKRVSLEATGLFDQQGTVNAAGPCQAGLNAIATETSMSVIGERYCAALAAKIMTAISATSETGSLAEGKRRLFGCFPEDARVVTRTREGVKSVALKDLRPGDYVESASAHSGRTFFTPVLTDFHSNEENSRPGVDYLMLVHNGGGSLNLTADHFIALEGRGMVPARTVLVGDRILIAIGGRLVPAEVEAIRHVTKQGLYAPLTWHGTLLVNGVLASSYTAPSIAWSTAWDRGVSYFGWGAIDWLSHVCMLPVRLAHILGLPPLLDGLTFIPGATRLKCFLSPCSENADSSLTGTTLPGIVDLAGPLVGSMFEWLPAATVAA
jgi:hypothetical protein